MVKHSQAIRRQFAYEFECVTYLNVFGHFVGLALKGLSSVSKKCKYTQWCLTVIYAIKSKNHRKIILKARKTVPI